MGVEIERKFRVASDAWREGPDGTVMRQGYLARDPQRTVRVRRAGEKGFLTVKGQCREIERAEFEYEIPAADADALLELCEGPLVEKVRFERLHEGMLWEIDEFHGDNEGLIVAEIELPAADTRFALPPWIGAEVSDDPRFYNSNLAKHPYRSWERGLQSADADKPRKENETATERSEMDPHFNSSAFGQMNRMDADDE